MKMYLTSVLFIYGILVWHQVAVAAVVVPVEQGLLEGERKMTITGDTLYYSFKGIPYAAPPTGKRRFKAPQPAYSWKGIRKATEHGNVYPQIDVLVPDVYIPGDEDCLFLNVYSPSLQPYSLLPIIFFIHGGLYVSGSGNDDRYGPDFLIDQNKVLVVTINYRLDNLGFLCLDSAEVPGNAGMKDQVAALRWVKKNIKNFGGDPNKVTIIGQSVGGSSVSLHALSPMSRGLFRRAIATSGVPINDFSIAFDQTRRAFLLGKKLGFQTTSTSALLKFLQTVPVRQLIDTNSSIIAAEDYMQIITKAYFTVPVVETDFGQERFLTEPPLISIEKGRNEVDMLLGYMSNEALIAVNLLENTSIIADYRRFPEVLVPRDIFYRTTPTLHLQMADAIRQYYTGAPMRSLNTIPVFVTYDTDLLIYPILRYARRLSYLPRNGDIYLFEFTSVSERNVVGLPGRRYGLTGVAHTEDLLYVFNPNELNLPINKSAVSYKMIQQICTLYTNFAIFGNPTPDASLGVVWPTYDAASAVYLEVGEELTLRENPKASTMSFWENHNVAPAIVSVEQGLLEGEHKWTISGDTLYYSFKGIPYAAPPTGSRRFKAPQPAQSWRGIRNARAHGSVCPQVDSLNNNIYTPGSEDCLFLNVYTPALLPYSLLPVMFFIHGGGYVSGSGNDDRYGPDFLIDQNKVLVVTINYRLDNLGFLCLDLAEVPGNAGMKDQVAALRWVKRNIKIFGGDPTKVTIFGESAGGSSVSLHALSPMSKGLFRRAIATSGVPIHDFSTAFDQTRRAFLLGKKLDYETTSTSALLKFLQTVPVRKLVDTNSSIITAEDYMQVITAAHFTVPVVETDFGQERFLTEPPLISVETGLNEVDMLLGYMSNEGLLFVPLLENTSIIADYIRFPEVLVPRDIFYRTTPTLHLETADAIRRYYTGSPLRSLNTIPASVSYATDLIIYPILRYARRLSNLPRNGDIYLFEFTSVSERNVVGLPGRRYGLTGVAHTEDLLYVFNPNELNLPINKSAASYKMIQQICALYANFAIFGNPTPDASLGVVWPTYDAASAVHLEVGEELTLRENPKASTMNFWENVYKLTDINF